MFISLEIVFKENRYHFCEDMKTAHSFFLLSRTKKNEIECIPEGDSDSRHTRHICSQDDTKEEDTEDIHGDTATGTMAGLGYHRDVQHAGLTHHTTTVTVLYHLQHTNPLNLLLGPEKVFFFWWQAGW